MPSRQALDASLAKAKSWSKHWEREAKAGVKKVVGLGEGEG